MTQESITRIGETKANWHLTSTFLRSLQLFQKLKVPRHWKAVMNMLKISNQYNTIRLPTLEYSNHQDMYAADVTFLLLLLLLLTDHYFSRWRALHIAVLTMSGVRGSRRTQAYIIVLKYDFYFVWWQICCSDLNSGPIFCTYQVRTDVRMARYILRSICVSLAFAN